MAKNKAVILGSNYYIGLSVIRCLGRKGVHVVAVDHTEHERYGGKSRYLKEKYIAPHHQKDPQGLVNFLVKYAKKQEVTPVLFPTADPWVEFVDSNFEILKEYYLFPMDRPNFWAKLMDKYEMAKLATEHHVLLPEIIHSKEDHLLQRVKDEIGYPCIVKPKDSPSFVKRYRHKAFVIKNEEELIEKVTMCHEDQSDIFIQRIIPGPETNCYCYDAHLDQNSKVTHYTSVYKLRQWPVGFGASTYSKQKWIPELKEICQPFLEGIKFKGFAEVELKRDEKSGKIYLIEVNVRYINFTELLARCGLNFPWITYVEMTTGKVSEPKAIDYDTNWTWLYLYEDIFAVKNYLKHKQMSLSQMIKDISFKNVASTWAWDDPRPGIYFLWIVWMRFWRRITGQKTRLN